MRIGLFYQIQVPKPWTASSESERIYEALEQIPYAEQQGFDSVWFSEHHFRPVWSHNSAPDLTLDPGNKTYYADGAARTLSPHSQRVIALDDWKPVDYADLSALQASGKGQPYARLLWLHHALGSNGRLSAELDADAKYKLNRWPQIDREFPRTVEDRHVVPRAGQRANDRTPDSARTPDAHNGRLTELLLQRCYKLAAEEYDALKALDTEIESLSKEQ